MRNKESEPRKDGEPVQGGFGRAGYHYGQVKLISTGGFLGNHENASQTCPSREQEAGH